LNEDQVVRRRSRLRVHGGNDPSLGWKDSH
jgi:hypothetical protein